LDILLVSVRNLYNVILRCDLFQKTGAQDVISTNERSLTGTLKPCEGQLTSLNPIRYLVRRFHTEYSSERREVFLAAFINIDRITGRERFTCGGK